MSFRPQAAGDKPPRGWEESREGPLGFLAPATPAREREADPQKAERKEDEARRKTLRTLNALRVVGPLIAAVMERPGPLASDEEINAAFRELVSSTSAFSERVAGKMGVDPADPKNFWVRNVLERVFSEALKEQWSKRKSASLDALEGPINALLQMEWSTGDRQFDSLSPDLAVKAALIRAGAPILMKAQTGFDFFRNMDKEIEPIMQRLMGAAAKATLDLSDDAASERDRASLFSVLIAEAGTLYATSWWMLGKKAVEDLERVSDAELKSILKEYPDGLPLEKVNSAFDKNFNRLVSVANKLVPPRAGVMSSRISAETREQPAAGPKKAAPPAASRAVAPAPRALLPTPPRPASPVAPTPRPQFKAPSFIPGAPMPLRAEPMVSAGPPAGWGDDEDDEAPSPQLEAAVAPAPAVDSQAETAQPGGEKEMATLARPSAEPPLEDSLDNEVDLFPPGGSVEETRQAAATGDEKPEGKGNSAQSNEKISRDPISGVKSSPAQKTRGASGSVFAA